MANTKILDAAKKGDFSVEEKQKTDSESDYATNTDDEDTAALENDNDEGGI